MVLIERAPKVPLECDGRVTQEMEQLNECVQSSTHPRDFYLPLAGNTSGKERAD